MKGLYRVITAMLVALSFLSCSTTRVLQEGEFRLAKNKIIITNDKDFNPNNLNDYLQQKPNSYFIFGWNPFLNIYNWSNGKGRGWDKFVQKIGVAPVVYDSELVGMSVSNLKDHLKYIGYYGSQVESRIEVRNKKVEVTYLVKIGKRYPIKDIVTILPEKGDFPEIFMADSSQVTIKKGDYLSEELLEAETVRAATAMRNQGFYKFNKNYFFFEADTLSVPDSAILQMTVNEYTRNESPEDSEPIRKFRFNDVTISYPSSLKIREKILNDLNMIIPGEEYSERLVNNT